jgi:hypothetical protein
VKWCLRRSSSQSDFFFDGSVLVEMFEFDEVLGTIEVEEGAGVCGGEVDAVERGEKAAGTALVFFNEGGELWGSRGGVEGAEGLGVIVERVQEAGGVF